MNALWTEAFLTSEPKQFFAIELEKSNEDLARTANLRGLKGVQCVGSAAYHPEDRSVYVAASIEGDVIVEDAVSLKLFSYHISIPWEEAYSFQTNNYDGDMNIITNSKGFSLNDYAVDQIIFNLPINLTQKNDKINSEIKKLILQDDDYNKHVAEGQDDRWNDLRDIIKDKDK